MTPDPLACLSTWRQRAEFLLVVVAIHGFDSLVSDILSKSGVLTEKASSIAASLEYAGDWVLAFLALICLIAIVRSIRHMIVPMVAVYLSFAVVHYIVNVAGVLLTAELHHGEPLTQLWDVVVVYFMGVFIFTAWYWFLDKITPGGVFLLPAVSGEKCTRTMIDYLFISFNVSSTFGPTTETPTTSAAKVLMMFQVCSSLLVLMVLLARAING